MKLDMLTEQDLRKLVLSRLQKEGLAEAISVLKSQFLEMSVTHDGFFAEVVLTDAGKLADAEKILRVVKDELAGKAISLDYIVRALWKIDADGVQRDRKPLLASAPMKRHLGILFLARLHSGSETVDVEILLTSDALDIAAARFAYPPSEPFQWSADKEPDERILKDLIIRFLEEQLSQGGESYWDPVKYQELELNGPAVLYLFGHSAGLMELVEAVNDAFDPSGLPAFLHALELGSIRIKEFDLVLPELSSFLGGPYVRGQVFSVSASALYSSLKPSEQELLRHHYLIKVERILAEHPEFQQQFPKLFK